MAKLALNIIKNRKKIRKKIILPRVGFEPALFLVDQNLVSESLSVQKNLMVFLIFHDELIMAQDSHMYQNDWKNEENSLA